MGEPEPGYTVLVKKTGDVEVGQKLRMVGEFTLKALKHKEKDERMITVQSIGEKSIDTGILGVKPVPARSVDGIKYKFYRAAKKKAPKTVKVRRVSGGRRQTRRK